jgi:DNA-binding Lrp family transcriptional regulator
MALRQVPSGARDRILAIALRHGVKVFGSFVHDRARPDTTPFFPGGLIADPKDSRGQNYSLAPETYQFSGLWRTCTCDASQRPDAVTPDPSILCFNGWTFFIRPARREMPTPKEKHEADMKAIVRYLHENPTATQRAISQATDLSEHQIKHMLDELKHEDHVTNQYIVDLAYLGFPLRYRVDIFVNPANLRDGKGGFPDDAGVDSQKALARYIAKKLPNKVPFHGKILVEDVRMLLGHPADLSATVRATNSDAIVEFVTEGLRMCGAINQTSSCLEAWSYPDH